MVLLRLAAAGLLLAIAAFAIATGLDVRRNADLAYLADELAAGLRVDRDVLAIYATRSLDAVGRGDCRRETLTALRTLHLINLDNQASAVDDAAWSKAIGDARTAFRHILSCAPGDGDGWARYANIELAIAALGPLVSDALDLSVATAPSDRHTLEARFRVWRNPIADRFLRDHRALESDVRTVLTFARADVAARLIEGGPPLLLQAAAGFAALVSPERRAALSKAGLDLDNSGDD